jgi:ABC-type transporter Mla subunit MlaD
VLTPGDVLQWSAGLSREVARLPVTLARARHLLVDLPTHLEGLVTELAATRRSLDAILPELSQLVGGMDTRLQGLDTSVATALEGLDTRLGHLDAVVSELGGSLTGVLGSIPGVRRAHRNPG